MSYATRPPTTYARRKSRSKIHDATRTDLPSSPLEELSPTAQDITLSEMSRRMRKRSRLAISGSQEFATRHAAEPMYKKTKSADSYGDLSALKGSLPSTPATLERPLLPLGTQQIYDSIFETPDITTVNDTIAKTFEAPQGPDQMSPIPLARRMHMLSRASSRNLKENPGRSLRLGLASPFSSRPGSRASSPFRASKPRPVSHVKARTLSTNIPKLKNISSSINRPVIPFDHDSILDNTYATSAPMSVSQPTLHTRTSSIPVMSSALFDDITPQDWLVPPKALSCSPSASSNEAELDSFQAEHPSFYFDLPVKASTPSRKRSTTVTQKSFLQHNDSALSSSDLDSDVVMGDSTSLTLHQPRRRRRTIVHMSSDSIFSTALDFSAYTSDDQRNVPVDPLSPQTQALNINTLVPHLEPAFSPAFMSATVTHPATPDACATAPASPVSVSSKLSTPSVIPIVESHSTSVLCRSHSLPSQPAADAELRDMFTMLELAGTLCSSYVLFLTALSCTIYPDEVHCGDLHPENGRISTGDSKRLGHTTEQNHSRKRGDTIRASDFPRPSAPCDRASASHASSSVAIPERPPATRRTRSGTVTLAVQSQPIEVIVTDGIRKPCPAARIATRRRAASRRTHGRATIIMKIDDEPLPPQGSDEEDDELLLTGQTWKDPPKGSSREHLSQRRRTNLSVIGD